MEVGAKTQNSAAGETADASVPVLTSDSGIVTSAEITQTTTGTGPFDSEEGDGNDTSANDNIVRSFDQVTWTLNAIIGINRTKHGSADAQTTDTFRGGKIYLEATLPESNKGQMHWDSNAMSWANGSGVLSDDGLTFTASYQFNENELMAQSQKLVAILQVDGAKNKTQIQPTFRLWMEGNETDETKSDYEAVKITPEEAIIVSAKPTYNIELISNDILNNLNYKTELDFGNGKIEGTIYGYGILLQLYNSSDNKDKGLKGMEYPTGDITFDINTKFESGVNNKNYVDITNQVTPLLWNYHINENKSTGVIENRDMYLVTTSHFSKIIMPYGTKLDDRDISIYNSGKISMTQEGNLIHTTIKEYDFDGTFPTKTYSSVSEIYPQNIGCFSAGYFLIFVPSNDANSDSSKSYRLIVSDENLNVNSISGQKVTTQEVTKDDTSIRDYIVEPNVIYSAGLDLDYKTGDPLRSRYGFLTKQIGSKMVIASNIGQPGTSQSTSVKTVDKLIKFDGEAFKLDGDKYTSFKVDSLNFKGWYVTKKDGTTWTSQEEMNNTKIEDLDVYSSLDAIPDDKLCVGVYFESQGTSSDDRLTSDYPTVYVNLIVKDTAKIGQTYAVVHDNEYWTETLDRTVYTKISENLEVKVPEERYPTPVYSQKNENYIKAEFDEDGNRVEGTYVKREWGNTVSIVGAEPKVETNVIDKVNGNTKTSYNLDANETQVTYEIKPALISENNQPGLTGVTVVVKDTLDEGLEYIPGQSSLEPDSIVTNNDGTTTVTWTINNCTVGEPITPIIFKAKIDENTPNNTQYSTTVEIEEDKEVIGTIPTSMKRINGMRATSQAITVINLASKRLYEEVVQPIIEKNGIVKYTVTYTNKDEDVDNFKLVNILPYNGDGLGTSFNGTYTLKSIKVSQTGVTSNDNLTLYVSNSNDAKTATSEDTDLGTSSIWSEKTIGATLNEQATAFAIKGNIKQNTVVEVEIELQTNENKPGDKYVNKTQADKMETANSTAQVVSRAIKGKVWLDSNDDGKITYGENGVKDINVTLLNEAGTQVATTTTNANGEYAFIDLAKGKYKVKVDFEEKLELTTKEVGSNSSINSKFNQDTKQTDLIEKLDSLQNTVITENNVNAGLTIKKSNITVKYLKENTTTPVVDETTVTGKVDSSYTPQAKKIGGYVLKSSTLTNPTVLYTLEPQTITYYYEENKQDVTVNVVWEDENNSANKRPESVKVELKNGTQKAGEATLTEANKETGNANKWTYTFKEIANYPQTHKEQWTKL